MSDQCTVASKKDDMKFNLISKNFYHKLSKVMKRLKYSIYKGDKKRQSEGSGKNHLCILSYEKIRHRRGGES